MSQSSPPADASRGRRGLQRLNVTWKLAVLGIVVVLGFIVFGLVASNTLQVVRVAGPLYEQIAQKKDLIADVLPPPEYIIEAYLVVLRMEDETNPARIESLRTRFGELRADYDSHHAAWSAALSPGPLKDWMIEKSYQPAVAFFAVAQDEFIPAVQKGDHARARALARGILARKYEDHRAAIDQVVSLARIQGAEEVERARELVQRRFILLLVIGVALVAFLIFFSGWIARAVREPLREVIAMISGFSHQLASTIEEQERLSSLQAASVGETTATMDELDRSFHQAGERAENASEQARQALALARGSQEAAEAASVDSGLKGKIATVTDQLLGLSEQTSQVDSITRAVSEIAHQTNMLALNAAVEAARAGDQGRGFGVVASEIRKLADESRRSAAQIHQRLEQIQNGTNSTVMSMEQGTKAVDDVARTLASLYETARQASFSLQQQITAVRQVTEAMEALNQGAQDAASGLSQAKAGMRTLCEAATTLSRMV
jgi:methyl-accepting chemotaxis protein